LPGQVIAGSTSGVNTPSRTTNDAISFELDGLLLVNMVQRDRIC